jgi:hypothetical protein
MTQKLKSSLRGILVHANGLAVFFCAVLLVLTCTLFCHGQINAQDEVARQNLSGPAFGPYPNVRFPGNEAQRDEKRTIFLEGKVVSETGNALWDTSVVLQCGVQSGGMESRTATNGFFYLQVSAQEGTPGFCDLYIDAAMYTQKRLIVRLDPSVDTMPLGTIVLSPVSTSGEEGSSTVSVLSLAAPPGAKKAYEKGRKEAKKGKWAAACDYFRKAIQLYPRFALAWLDLGRAQAQQNNIAEAQHSFEEATNADSHLTGAYVELTRMAAKRSQWDLLVNVTDRALQISPPESTPWFCFFNSLAKLTLGNVPGAQTSATRGLRLDVKRNVPSLEYIYGLILAKQENYSEAIEHIKAYLEMAPHASDTQIARDKLSEFERKLLSQ